MNLLRKFLKVVIIIELLITLSVCALLFLTVLCDMRTHKIPNVILLILLFINFFSLFFFFICNAGTDISIPSVCANGAEILFIFVLLFSFFSVGALGAGDVKLVVIMLLPCRNPLSFTFIVLGCAAVQAVGKMLFTRSIVSRMRYLWLYIKGLLVGGSLVYEDTHSVDMKTKVHLSVSVLAGFIIYSFQNGVFRYGD